MGFMNALPTPPGVRPGFAGRWRQNSIVALALLAAGCQELPLEPEPQDGPPAGALAGGSRPGRESAMNEQWRNRSYSDLMATMGQPVLIMTIPGGGNPPGFVAVYGKDTVSGCIDAFAMMYGRDPTIRVYHCR